MISGGSQCNEEDSWALGQSYVAGARIHRTGTSPLITNFPIFEYLIPHRLDLTENWIAASLRTLSLSTSWLETVGSWHRLWGTSFRTVSEGATSAAPRAAQLEVTAHLAAPISVVWIVQKHLSLFPSSLKLMEILGIVSDTYF